MKKRPATGNGYRLIPPIGTKVKMVKCLEAKRYTDKIFVTRSEPYMVCGIEVVLLEGRAGGFATEFLEIVKPLEPQIKKYIPPLMHGDQEDYIEAICPNCGESFYSRASECGKCGQPIKWPEEP